MHCHEINHFGVYALPIIRENQRYCVVGHNRDGQRIVGPTFLTRQDMDTKFLTMRLDGVIDHIVLKDEHAVE